MNIGIIGGGASGMMAAITAAKSGSTVTIFESNDRIGKKILVTGNGKCNLSNLSFSDKYYYSDDIKKVQAVFEGMPVQDTLAVFSKLGLCTKEKNGYIYPLCEQASAVLDVLRYEIEARKITVLYKSRIQKVSYHQGFQVCCDGQTHCFDRLILACGGKAAPKTGSDGSGYKLAETFGHTVNPVVPALVQLRCRGDFFSAISGVRCEAVIRLYNDDILMATERGELQLTDYGISGIPVFQLSRFAAYGLYQKQRVHAVIDFLPSYTEEELGRLIKERISQEAGRSAEQFFTGILHKKLMLFFMKKHGISPQEILEKKSLYKIEELIYGLKEFLVQVESTNSFDNAQICAGGVSLLEVSENLESKKIPGLFFAGELLDVDGRCGGYNLQWAWSSGYIAGINAAKE